VKANLKKWRKLPLGGIITLLKKQSIVDSKIVARLEEYNKDRVDLVHYTVSGSLSVSLDRLYELGQSIIVDLNEIVQSFFTKRGIDHKW
jgi:hypothetical protein